MITVGSLCSGVGGLDLAVADGPIVQGRRDPMTLQPVEEVTLP